MQIFHQNSGFRIRAMSYNIHSCVGMDKKLNPERIARVIGDANPDIVALQEVDNGIPRTRYQDQAGVLAEILNMNPIFFPVVNRGSQKYGLAMLNRLKCIDIHCDWLPRLHSKLRPNLQERGCLRTTFLTPSGSIHFFNTHLSLYRLERRRQMRALIGSNWLDPLLPESATVFCGDLNAGPSSTVYRHLSRLLSDVQRVPEIHARPKSTFPSRHPILRIDHMFVSNSFRVLDVQVPRTTDTRLASDHLPVIADLELIRNV
jgi:endonuclease/exonuclease/phosphatase family metal-dependent hydrolase